MKVKAGKAAIDAIKLAYSANLAVMLDLGVKCRQSLCWW